MGRNAGFGAGCNAGVRAGRSPAVLFLNPDARMDPDSVRHLGAVLEEVPQLGAVGPHLVEVNGDTQLTMRRAPSLRTAFAEALFLHHVLPGSSEVVKAGYEAPNVAEWLSGAALCVRRSAFDAVGGFDERLFLYSEDTDLCVRLRGAGY